MSERWVTAAAGVAVAAWIARHRPPPADPAFRAALAETFERLGAEPRPVGSAAHERAGRALADALREAGAVVTQPEATVCGGWGGCAHLRNVIGRFGPPGPAIALVAHYDSVAAGPGAADDGAGVAAGIALARRYREAPPSRGVWIVFTDAEELGLLGARAWVSSTPDVAAVVNLEARGTSGPSLLFETTGATGPRIARFAQVATRPFTSSLYDTVYQLLPNDTDLSAMRALDVPGYNLAFMGDPLDYHTPADRWDRLSIDAAAHQAANAIALVDAWVAEPEPPSGGRAVWFDLFGAAVVRVPEGVATGLACLAAAALAWTARTESPRALLRGAGVGIGIALGSAAAGAAVVAALHGPSDVWLPRAGAVTVALAGVGAASGIGGSALAPDRGSILGGWLAVAAIGVALAVALPGAAYLAWVPALVAAAAGGRWGVGGLAALVVWSPVVGVLYDAVGSPLGPAVSIAAAAATAGLGLARWGRRLAVACGGVAAIAAGVAAAPTDAPLPANRVVEFGPAGAAVFAEGAPAPVALPAAPPAPEVTALGPGRYALHSRRGAATLGVRWTGGVRVWVDGVDATTHRDPLWIHGVPDGVEIRFDPVPQRIEWVDETAERFGRPAGTVPFQWGDRLRAVTEVR